MIPHLSTDSYILCYTSNTSAFFVAFVAPVFQILSKFVLASRLCRLALTSTFLLNLTVIAILPPHSSLTVIITPPSPPNPNVIAPPSPLPHTLSYPHRLLPPSPLSSSINSPPPLPHRHYPYPSLSNLTVITLLPPFPLTSSLLLSPLLSLTVEVPFPPYPPSPL
jgi:hypothetical protein